MTDNYDNISIINTSSTPTINAKFYGIKVFSKSREVNLLKKLSDKRESYYSIEISKKIFNKYKLEGQESDLFLKNKYLYLTTRGVLNYLNLYRKQSDNQNKNYYKFEIDKIANYLKQNKCVTIISLGAANSDKEIKIFNNLFDNDDENTINYYPVDVSNFLIHLGIMKFSENNTLNKINVNSIIADFWDLAGYINEGSGEQIEKKRSELFGAKEDKNRIFLLLGGTFGNYTENELLNQIIELMDIDDILVISVKLLKEEKDKDNNINNEYDYPEDSDFLLEPLTYIPYYYGFYRYRRDLLIKKEKDVILTDDDANEKKFISVVPKSQCYAPYIKVKNPNSQAETKIRLAWTTRYKLNELEKWIEGFRSRVKNDGDYILSKQKVINENDYALLFLKKDWYNYNDDIKKHKNYKNFKDKSKILNCINSFINNKKKLAEIYQNLENYSEQYFNDLCK